MELLFSIGLHNTAIMAFLAILVWSATRIWRSAPAAHLLWLLVLVKLITPPIVHFDVSRWTALTGRAANSADAPQVIDVRQIVSPLHDRRPQLENNIPSDPEPIPPLEPAQHSTSPGVIQSPTPEPSQPQLVVPSWGTIRLAMAWTWLTVAALIAGVAGVRIVRFRRILSRLLPASRQLQSTADDLARRMGVKGTVAVFQVENATAPFVWCFGSRPAIVLPSQLFETLDAQPLEMVLAHELAHLRRRDHWVRVAELAVSILYWWNPLVWWVRRQLHAAEEECCDAWVAWLFPDQNHLYAECLLKSAEIIGCPSLVLSSPFLNKHTLKARVEMVLKNSSQRKATRLAAVCLGLFAAVTIPMGISVVRGQVHDEPKADQTLAQSPSPGSQLADSKPTTDVAPQNSEKPVEKELEPFQGIWPMDICDSINKTLYAPQKEVNNWRWEIKGNKIRWSRSGGEVWHLTFKVDPTKSPKEIDLTYVDGPFKGQTCLGMYEWGGINNNMLQMSLQDPGVKVPRPQSISMTGESQTSLIFLNPRQSLVSQTKPNPTSKPGVNPVPVLVAKEVEPLKGTWAVDSCKSEAGSLKVSEFAARRWRWTIMRDEVTWGREGQQWRLSANLRSSTTPRQIDLTFLDGPYKGETCLGIYERSGDEGKNLTIRMQDPAARVERPTDFVWQSGSQTSLIVLRSIPPIDPGKELASFQGTWSWDYSQPWTWPQPIGVGTDSDGRNSEKRWMIEGNRITWVGRDGQRVYVTFTIDPFKAPRQIEFTFLNGPRRGQKSIGIYESKDDDDYRTLCMTDPGTDAPRPTDFSAGTFLKQSIIAVHRVAPPAKPSAVNELKRLQGVWQMQLCDSTHETFGGTQQEASKWQWTMKDDQILWSRQGDVWKLKLHVDPPKSPREMDLTYHTAPFEMDLTFLTGPFQGAKCQGIFGWGGVDKQSLMIAIQDPGSDAPRPTKFHMSSDVKTGLMILRPSKPSDAERENAALQGTWTLRNFDTGNFDRNTDPSSWPLPGGKGPDKSGEGSQLRWVVKQNEISWTSPSGQEIKASFTIDPGQTPKQIDLTFLSGPHKGQTCPGIYQRDDLDENILWLCIADPNSKMFRPKEFAYQWGEGRSLLSLYPFRPSDPR